MARVTTPEGIEIEYQLAGSGEPVLLVMGLGTSSIFWPPELLEVLHANGFATIAVDNRDVGLSTFLDTPAPTKREIARALTRRPGTAAYTVPEMARDALAVLDDVGARRAHLVGVSMGGMIVQQLAIDHPERVASLCSVMSHPGDGISGMPRAAFLARAARIAARPTATTPEENVAARLAFLTLIGGPAFDRDELRMALEIDVARGADPVGTLRHLMAVGASPNRTPGLRRVTAPTLVVHGMRDPLVRPSGGAATARAVRGSLLLMFPEMGHDLPRGRRVEIAEAIVANARRASGEVDAVG